MAFINGKEILFSSNVNITEGATGTLKYKHTIKTQYDGSGLIPDYTLDISEEYISDDSEPYTWDTLPATALLQFSKVYMIYREYDGATWLARGLYKNSSGKWYVNAYYPRIDTESFGSTTAYLCEHILLTDTVTEVYV